MAGRPTKYNSIYNEQVYKLCLLGAIDSEISDFFNIAESTLNLWKTTYPEFMESIKKGKILADATVSESLYKSANGYEHEDTDIRVVLNEVVETPIMKYYPPNPTSIIFFLKNRQPAKWRDKTEHILAGDKANPLQNKHEHRFIIEDMRDGSEQSL